MEYKDRVFRKYFIVKNGMLLRKQSQHGSMWTEFPEFAICYGREDYAIIAAQVVEGEVVVATCAIVIPTP